MQVYQSKQNVMGGSDFTEVYSKARWVYNQFRKKTKRRPYIKAPYFQKNKVFIDYFWQHLEQKHSKDRVIRMKYLACAYDLITNSRIPPISKQNPNKPNEILHRFAGRSKDKKQFLVQIKENTKTDQKLFMSVFPP